MIDFKLWSRRLVLALMVIAGLVFLGQVLRLNVWWLICLYWAVLTLKNYMDWSASR